MSDMYGKDLPPANSSLTILRSFLFNSRRLPGRLSADETACFLNAKPHDIPVLVRAKLIKPQGKPAQSGPKWFGTTDVLSLCQEAKAMDKITLCLSQHWKKRNG